MTPFNRTDRLYWGRVAIMMLRMCISLQRAQIAGFRLTHMEKTLLLCPSAGCSV